MAQGTNNAVALADALAARVTSDSEACNKQLSVLSRASSSLTTMKTITAASCVMVAIEHGNCTRMNQFIAACGKGERNAAIVKWACDFGPFVWGKEEVLIEGKLTNVNMFKMDTPKREALKVNGPSYAKVLVETPYFEYVPQTEVPVFDLVIAMKALVKRADKAKENPTIADKSNFNGLDALRALVA